MYFSRICFLRKEHIIVVQGCQTQGPRWGWIWVSLLVSTRVALSQSTQYREERSSQRSFSPVYLLQRGKPAKLRPSLPNAVKKDQASEALMSRYNRQNLNPGLSKIEKSLQRQLLNQDVSSFR
uniref:Uncharacterized protein n=1 Tax=Micrurus spixii TaxID=129469 RepID=A0A2D4LQQ2_9SAUR